MTREEMLDEGLAYPEDFRSTWWLHYEAPDRAQVYVITEVTEMSPGDRHTDRSWTAHLHALTFRQMTVGVGYGWQVVAFSEVQIDLDRLTGFGSAFWFLGTADWLGAFLVPGTEVVQVGDNPPTARVIQITPDPSVGCQVYLGAIVTGTPLPHWQWPLWAFLRDWRPLRTGVVSGRRPLPDRVAELLSRVTYVPEPAAKTAWERLEEEDA